MKFKSMLFGALCFSCLQVWAGQAVPGRTFNAFSPDGLPQLNIDKSRVTVSGVSSGGYMAVQLHVAYSATFSGVAVFAGGIYDCAEGSQMQALTACMSMPQQIDSARFVSKAQEQMSAGNIDNLSHLKSSHVYLFAGTQDYTVRPESSVKLKEFYEQFVDPAAIATDFDVPSAHGQPTLDYGAPCNISMSPWLLNCSFDGAGKALQQLYPGQLRSRGSAEANHLRSFDQSLYSDDSALIARTGYVYVPESCAKGKACGLHVAIHGCQQSPATVGDAYMMQSGYTQWAESNHLVVLFPAAQPSTGNPMGCWDWWGYGSPDYFNQKGPQMRAVKTMVDSLIR